MSEPLTEDKSDPPLPVALRFDEITEAEAEHLFRIARDPNSTVGRPKRVPRGIPLMDEENRPAPSPLTEEQLHEYAAIADALDAAWSTPVLETCNTEETRAVVAIRALIDEVARLRAREAELVSDIELIGVGLAKQISDLEVTSRKPSCPSCGSSSIKRCDSEHSLCEDYDLLFRAKETL